MAFPDGNSALMLAAARLRHIAGTKWGTRKFLDMERLKEGRESTAEIVARVKCENQSELERVS